MPTPQRDPFTHRSVRLVNQAPVQFRWTYDSQPFVIPAANDAGPGEAIVPYNLMRIYLGDPEALNTPRHRYRADEFRRVRTKHGVHEMNEKFKCDLGAIPDGDFISPVGKQVGQVWWTETGIPPVEAFDPETGLRFACPGYDPEGTSIPEIGVMAANASLETQVAALQAQMSRLLAQQANADDDIDDEEESQPVASVRNSGGRRRHTETGNVGSSAAAVVGGMPAVPAG